MSQKNKTVNINNLEVVVEQGGNNSARVVKSAISVSGPSLSTVRVRNTSSKSPLYKKGISYSGTVEMVRHLVDSSLFDWFKKTQTGETKKVNMSIILKNEAGTQEVLRYNLSGVWPVSYTAPTVSKASNEEAIESVILSYDDFELVGI